MTINDGLVMQALLHTGFEGRANSIWKQRLVMVYLLQRCYGVNDDCSVFYVKCIVSDMSRTLNVPNRTAHRILKVLEGAGYLHFQLRGYTERLYRIEI